MNDSKIYINAKTPGFKLVTVDRNDSAIDTLFDKGFSGAFGVESYSRFINCSQEDAMSIKNEILIEVAGELTKFRAAANPEFDGTGLATVKLEEYYE